MVITDFLKMVLRYFTAEDKATLFADWRQELNDNFVKIDDFAKDTKEKTDILQTDGTGERFLANDGTYKLVEGGGGGARSVVFDREEYESFTATTPTNTFVAMGMNENKLISIVFDGLEMIKDVNYTINKVTGVVTLGFELKAGETIYYKTLYGIDNAVVFEENEEITGDVAFDADTLEGHRASYFATEEQINVLNYKGVVNDINIDTYFVEGRTRLGSNITGTLPTTISIDVIDHSDLTITNDGGIIIQKLITTNYLAYNVYANIEFTRIKFYENAWSSWKQVATTDLNDYKYHPTVTTPNNLPSGKWYMRSSDNPTDDFYYIDCGTSPASGYVYQRASYVFLNKTYERVQTGGVWQPWQEIATTEQINVLSNNGLNGNLVDGLTLPTNMNNVNSIGQYEVVWDTTNISNFPPVAKGVTRLRIKVEKLIGNMYLQEIEFQAGTVASGIWYRNLIDDTWQPWQQIATTEITTSIPFESGWLQTAQTAATASTVGNIVSVGARINGGSDVGGSVICTLPYSFPSYLGQLIVPLYSTTSIVGTARVIGNKLYMVLCTDTTDVSFNFSYFREV